MLLLPKYFENKPLLPTRLIFFFFFFRNDYRKFCFSDKIPHPRASVRRLVTAGWVLETAASFYTSLKTKTQPDRMHKLDFPTWNLRLKHVCKAANIVLALAIQTCPSISNKDCRWLARIPTSFSKSAAAEENWTKILLFLTLDPQSLI